MARLPRLALAGLPHHVLQRGHHHQPVFVDDDDRRAYLQAVQESAANLRVAVHAYVLLDDQVQLLLTPPTAPALSQLMQAVGRRYVSAYNRRHQRTGTLWDGRFRAAVLDEHSHLLACVRCIEQSPQLAGCVGRATVWPWSSAAHHVGSRRDPLLTVHPRYWALGNTPFERELAWQRLLDEPLPAVLRQQIAQAVNQGWVIGSGAFLASMAHSTARPLAPRPRGRPPGAPKRDKSPVA